MTMIRKLIAAEIREMGDDEVEVVMSTSALARDGHILIPQGVVLDNYRANPIVLWSHDPDKPVGNAEETAIAGDSISARVRFAPIGISHKADEVRGLTKAGVIRAVSVGFEPLEMEPLDPKRPKGGQRISKWELLELSFVSVPADPGAVVTARANGDNSMSDTNATDAKHLNRKSGRSGAASGQRVAFVGLQRGLYQVAELCWLFESLGCQVDCAKYESAIEGDGSKVPGMLADVLQSLGDALLAMTAEEVAEALAGHDAEPEDDDDDAVLVESERVLIRAATSPRVRAFRRGLAQAKLRAGKTLSTETIRCMREAKAMHEDAMDLHRQAMRKHKDGIAAVNDMMDRAGVSDDSSDATQTVQTSEGTAVDEGSRAASSAAYRRRQVELLALPPI